MSRPEKPTLIERFVQLIPLPYSLASLVWASIIGSPGFHTYEYLDHGSTTLSFEPSQIVNEAIFVVLPFYLFIIARHLRLRVINAESQILPVLPGGESDYHAAMGPISRDGPVLILSFILWNLGYPLASPSFHIGLLPIVNIFLTFINTLGIATLMWEYARINWGLHKLGESQLALRSFLEDRMMGLRPIGNVALASTVAYFVGILFVTLLFPQTFLTQLPYQALLIVFFSLGIGMFFLPLNSVHKKMQAEKSQHQRELAAKFIALKQTNPLSRADGPASIERVESAISELVKLKDLELTKRELAGTPTWPFDVQLIVKLVTIVLSVTAALLSRVIITRLGL